MREAEAIFRKLLPPLVLWLGDNLRNQSISFYHQGKYREALKKAAEALSIYRQSFDEHYDHYPTTNIKGLSLARTGQTDEGERLVREAVKMRVDSLPADHYWVLLAQSALGECLTVQQRYSEAEPLLVESHQKLTNSQGAENARTKLAKRRLDTLHENWWR